MTQIGNIHVGKANTAVKATISIQEAAFLWDFLVGRYKCMEETDIYLNLVKDPDFKVLLQTGQSMILTKQAEKVEKELEKFQLPMPKRNPKSYKNLEDIKNYLSDEFMFRQVFEGCQGFIDYVARISRSMVTHDYLRNMFIEFLKEEISIFDKMCKYGKIKGWLEAAPTYKN